ncbi:MAG: hypothetical protein RIT81_31445 [Deltaproteobacteria bacterium]
MDAEHARRRDLTSELRASIEGLYDAFATYPLRATVPGCPHCELERAERALHARPLRELSWDDLGVFVFKAMTTFGEEEDFKHFLPRILELHARKPFAAKHDVDVVFGKLNYASSERWPDAERAAVRHFIDSWTHELKAKGDQGDSPMILEELLSALTLLEPTQRDTSS